VKVEGKLYIVAGTPASQKGNRNAICSLFRNPKTLTSLSEGGQPLLQIMHLFKGGLISIRPVRTLNNFQQLGVYHTRKWFILIFIRKGHGESSSRSKSFFFYLHNSVHRFSKNITIKHNIAYYKYIPTPARVLMIWVHVDLEYSHCKSVHQIELVFEAPVCSTMRNKDDPHY